MTDENVIKFVEHLQKKDIDCAALVGAIHAAKGVDLSRVLWSLAHLRHIRDIELYKKDMPDKCRQVIQHVADLCAIQAHTNVASEAWEAARVAAAEVYAAADSIAYAVTESAVETASALYPIAYSAYAAASSASAYTMYSAAYSASAASAVYSTPASAQAAGSAHYKWERDTLTALISAVS